MLCNWFLVRNFDTYKPKVWATSSQNQFEIFPNEGNIQYFVGLTRTVFTLEYDDFTCGDSYLSSCISLLAELLEYTTNAFISWDSISDSLRSKSCDWMDKIVWSSGMKEQAYFSCSCSVLVLGPKFFFVLVLFVLCSRVLESQSKKRSWSNVMCSTTGLKVYGLFARSPWSLREKYTICGSIPSLGFETIDPQAKCIQSYNWLLIDTSRSKNAESIRSSQWAINGPWYKC